MSAISTILTRLRAAIWAIDVRDDIANAIEQCYSDVSNPTLKTEALEVALQNKIDQGEMAALTIGDGTITAAKLASGVIDNTLATSGAAADAKKTGDEISAIKADLGAIKGATTKKLNSANWEQGYWATGSGSGSSSDNYIRYTAYVGTENGFYINVPEGFAIRALYYSENNGVYSYSGAYTDWVEGTGKLIATNPQAEFMRFVIKKVPTSAIIPTEAPEITINGYALDGIESILDITKYAMENHASWIPYTDTWATYLHSEILDDGSVNTNNKTVRTLKIVTRTSYTTRYWVKILSGSYEYKVAAYSTIGQSDFNSFIGTIIDWTTRESFNVPLDAKAIIITFRRLDGANTTQTDADAIKNIISLGEPTDISLTKHGVAADAYTVGRLLESAAGYPELTATQKNQILSLVNEYYDNRFDITYYFNNTVNALPYKSYMYDSNNGKLRLNCGLFAQMVWSGVSYQTFANRDTYNGTVVKAFDWGYFHMFYAHQRAEHLAQRNENLEVTKLYGLTNAPTPKYPTDYDSYSYTSRYDESETADSGRIYVRENGELVDTHQRWKSFMTAAHQACELQMMGYEVPIGKADVGDLVFYEQLPFDMNPNYNNRFRRIDHVAVVIGRVNGFIEIAECTSYFGDAEEEHRAPILKHSIFSTDDFLAAKSAHGIERIVLCVRHPAAYGVESNVPSVFTAISDRRNG